MQRTAFGLMLIASIAGAQTKTPLRDTIAPDTTERWPTGTFSILAYDPETGEIGGAPRDTSPIVSSRHSKVDNRPVATNADRNPDSTRKP
jgi:hypothetical protein